MLESVPESNKICFITPWFGPALPGGAERATREYVRELRKRDVAVMVATTTARDFYHWDDFHPPGVTECDGVQVHRFLTNRRNISAFDRVNALLLQGRHISAWEEAQFFTQMIGSEKLYRFLWKNREEYCFIFIPYLFGTTLWGLRLNLPRAYLIPCAHDEPYLSLPRVRHTMKRARKWLCLSEGEREVLNRVFGEPQKSVVIGLGIESDRPTVSTEKVAQFCGDFALHRPFFYLPGRKQPEKNSHLALRYFRYFLEQCTDEKPILFFSGPGHIEIPSDLTDWVRDGGFLDEQQMQAAYNSCLGVLIPSERESFSYTMYEAWVSGKPVLVHENCAATATVSRRIDGGLTFKDEKSFAESLHRLMSDTSPHHWGENGRRYVKEQMNWDRVIDRLLQALNINSRENSAKKALDVVDNELGVHGQA